MKANVLARRLTVVVCAFFCCVAVSAQKCYNGYYTQYYNDKALIAEAKAWVESGEWRNGYDGALPHSSVNVVDFYLQYKKNPEQWKALFLLAQRSIQTIS